MIVEPKEMLMEPGNATMERRASDLDSGGAADR